MYRHHLDTHSTPVELFTLSNGFVFRSPGTTIGSAPASMLLNESPPLAPAVAKPVNGRQRFPRYLPATADGYAAALSVYPSLRLPPFGVSVPRDSKAGDLPGYTGQSATDYLHLPRGNGLTIFRSAAYKAAVTRLSYTATPSLSTVSRRVPEVPAGSDFSAQPSIVSEWHGSLRVRHVSRALGNWPQVGVVTDFRRATGFNAHFLALPVSVSPKLAEDAATGFLIRSKQALQPAAPSVAAPAPLRARGFTVLAQAGKPAPTRIRAGESGEYRWPTNPNRPARAERGFVDQLANASLTRRPTKGNLCYCVTSQSQAYYSITGKYGS